MMTWHRIFFLLTVLLLSGCAEKFPILEVVEPLPADYTCRTVVLPFSMQNKDKYPRGEEIFYKTFTAELSSVADFEVVPEGDILSLYNQFKLYRKTQLTEDQIQVIAERLDAQFVMTGDILLMHEEDSGRDVTTAMTLVVRIHDGATGKLLWGTYHKRTGEEYRHVLHYGRVNTISGLAKRMSNEIITKWLEQGMERCAR